ncbi:DMT family transporter [Levilactobacillus zymae]|uniref:Permease of the drug/metabolite transporter (DMT) superfamily n=1 Tax=Levilactobacillus zymae TaxID=267363 RepID=A0A1Y6JUA1_9LACO|nr:DMT family transporter [Levilactobacillus zymae]KRL08687.1 hypothetical protein FD38_GL002315 [Levilactobacillus zymae DSM 19395]QFR61527.1 EamA family transporter [Levilactobacillus zymae]GEO72086.1 hypothetical protein LZY01_12540 [Levilactobacillus zymae]SMS13425.1 Permease of the drug/metabolite transporter (DMT) superfamily [Levilactobacillus zymae]
MTKKLAAVLAGTGAIFFGISGILSSILFARIAVSPGWLVSARMFFSGLLLLAYLLVTKQPIFKIWRSWRSAGLVIAFGVLGVCFAQSTFLLSLYYGNAAVATILQSLGPAILILLVALATRRLPRWLDIGAVLLSLVGILLLVTGGKLTSLVVPTPAFVWGVASAFGIVAYTLIPCPLLKHNHSLVVTGWGLFIGGVAANFLTPLTTIPAGFDGLDFLLVAGIVVVGTLLAYAFYVESLNALDPAVVSMLGTLEPLTATVLSVLCLNVSFCPVQFVGIVLTIVAILLINLPQSVPNLH